MGFFLTLILFAAVFVLSEVLRPRVSQENAKPAGLGDFSFPTATEGRVVPLVWGTVELKGPNVVWYGDLRQRAIKDNVKTGLFSSDTVVRGFKYDVGIQFALCRGGPTGLDALLAVSIGDEEVFSGTVTHDNTFTIDEPDLFGGDDLGQGGVQGTLRFFAGTPDQSPSGYLGSGSATSATVAAGGSGYVVGEVLTLVGGTGTSSAQFLVTAVSSGAVTAVALNAAGVYSVTPTSPVATTSNLSGTGCTLTVAFGGFQAIDGKTPAYRGTAYVAPDLAPIYVGNSTNIQPWKFLVRRIPTGPATGANESVNSGNDANPINVIYEVLTDIEWGLRQDAGTIDTANFAAAGATLKTEGNGFSFVLDKKIEAEELIQLLEQQIDGKVFFNNLEGKWQVKLARADYDPDLVPELTPANCRVTSFARGSWRSTTNQVFCEFNDRADAFKLTSAIAQDSANIRLQGEANSPVTIRYPGVKDRVLANRIVWRDLRTVAFPLAKASVVVDRSFFDVLPSDPITFTSTRHGVSKLPMRVQRIDYGELEDGKIGLDLVQDVFYFQEASYGTPEDSRWEAPSDTLVPFNAGEQVAFEAPRAFVARDPLSAGIVDKLWAAARRKGPEVSFRITERHAVGSPAGAFTAVGEVFDFMFIGRLTNNLPAGSAVPLASLLVTANPDTQAAIEAGILDGIDPSELGTDLTNLILVGQEFMVPSSAQNSGANVQLNGVYRGVLDTVQAGHSAGDPVYLVSVGGGLSDQVVPAGNNVDVKLLPRSATDEVSDAVATAISFAMDDRIRRPYPPSTLRLDAVLWASTTSLEGGGSTPEDFAIPLNIRRRDFRLADTLGDEVGAIDLDAPATFPDFPTAHATEHDVEVRNDPAGANTLLFTDTFATADHDVLRIRILQATDGVLPTRLRFTVTARHTFEAAAWESRQSLVWDFDVTSALTGDFNFGALDTNETSNLYTATVAGTYNFTLSSAFSAGDVEYRVNAGAWTTLISAGNTTGSILGVLVSDTIEVRHTSADVGALKFLEMAAAGAGQDGYAVLYV